MKPNIKVAASDLIKMIQDENRAQYHKRHFEIESPLSRICDSSDALGPLIFTEKLGYTKWRLSGDVFYSRFRPGDRVEIRVQKLNADISLPFSDGWKIETVGYPSPGKIELVVSGSKPFEEDGLKEVFLFKSSSSLFQNLLIKKLREMPQPDRPIIMGTERFKRSIDHPQFRALYEELNDSQKTALHHLIGNEFSGAIQGPPGTGKTQLLQAVITLVLNSNLKVGIASFTNAAVDNLLARVVRNNFHYDWVRVGDAGRVRKELYPKDSHNYIAPSFSAEINECDLIGTTLHKLAFNNSAPKFDLLVIDEAGQVPVFFWPFIQRLCKRLILVGDQFQLPPVLEAPNTHLPVDNIFSLFIDLETPMLETQYRMRREIQTWSSEKFYKGKLLPHVSVANRDFFAYHPAFMNDGYVVSQQFNVNSESKYSQHEANFITDKIEKLLRGRDDLETVGVICPYRAQAGIINASLQNRLGVDAAAKILVDTVERFQGQEKEAIFFSCGTSGSSQKERQFLSDPRRLNVAVTRAKSRFYCLSDERLLNRSKEKSSADLNEFLQWAKTGRTFAKKTG